MRFDRDPVKNRANIRKHHIDLADASAVFAGRTWERMDDRRDYAEERWVAVGMLHGIEITVVYTDLPTEEGEVRQIISARRATRMSVKRTTAKSAAKPKARPRKRDAAGTDWRHLRGMTDAQAERGAAGDPDNPPADPTWLAAGHLVEPVRKLAVSLRLDPDVLGWFRDTGPRYQSRMNAVLRAFVEHQRRIEDAPRKGKRTG